MTKRNDLFPSFTKLCEMKLLRIAGVSFLLLCASSQYTVADTNEKEILSTTQQVKVGTVTGVVTDPTGETIIGASVVVKGTTNGTITDIDGNYTLSNVPVTGILEFSYVGMQKQAVKVEGKTTINVVLAEDSEVLDEVVVTALGLKREQKALGYAVTEVKGDALRAANTISPVAALQGKVAGVEIRQSDGGLFGAAKIQIRGASTLKGNNQPIYVVDGVILDNGTSGNTDLNWGANSNDYGNELKNLNADDFETVSVLKGAAATALYGSRGLNGAVVITTKGGEGVQGIGVSFSQTFGIDHVFKTPDIQTEYGVGLYPGWADTDGDGNAWNPYQYQINSSGAHTLLGNSAYGYGFGPRYDGGEIENYDGTMTSYSPHKNNMLDMYDIGFNTNTNVAIRGGNEKTTFYSSLSYKHANSTTPKNTFERYSFLVKATHKLSKRVDVAASVNFTNSTPRNAAQNIGENFVLGTWNPLYDAKYFRNKYAGDHGGLASTSYGDAYGSVPGRSYWFGVDNNEYTQKETVIRPQFEVNIQIMDWLKFKADGSMNYYYVKGENKVLGSGYVNEGGEYKMWQNTKEQTTFGGTFTVNKSIKDFYVGGFARFEYYNNQQSNYSVRTDGGMIVPGEWFVGNSKKPKVSEAGISGSKRMLSAIFAANLSWKSQLYLDITGRNDWSSSLVYANGGGNYSYFYPSVSGSWLLSETFEMPSWVTLAKVRGSWAQVGNDADPYSINQAYSLGSIEMPDGTNIYTNSLDRTLKTINLKPERKNAWEIGIDFRTFGGRLNLDATYYRENTKNQIMDIAVPGISGVDTQKVNAGNIQNQGVEIALNTIPFKNKDWEWNLDFTWTKNVSKIVSLHPNVADYIALSGQVNGYDYRIGSVAKVGGAYGLLMSDILPAINENGEVLLNWSDADRAAYTRRSGKVEEVGKMTPDFLGSISTGVRWKDLSLHVGLDMRFGGLVAMYSNHYGSNVGWTGSSLKYRDEAHGGVTWTSKYMEPIINGDKEIIGYQQSGSYGMTYHDGYIPNGVFAPGTSVTGVDGKKHDVAGKSYADLVKDGILEPMHAGAHYDYEYSWGQGTINDNWVHELNFIALRDITLTYQLPKNIAKKVGARNLSLSASARNLGYLYNSLPNNVNPESIRGNVTSEFRIRGYEPYTASYMLTINAEF